MANPSRPRNPTSRRYSPRSPLSPNQEMTHAFATLRRTVRIDGEEQQLSNYEAMERRLFATGIAGNSIAQREYLRRVDATFEANCLAIAEECERWTTIKAQQQKQIAAAKASGSTNACILPHPDDIVIDPERGVQLLGPIDDEDWKRFDRLVKMRDAFYLQQAMEDVVDRVSAENRPTQGAALVAAMLFNIWLPPSLQLTTSDQFAVVLRQLRLSQREALLQCRAAWRAAGCRTRRGQRFGSLEKFIAFMEALAMLVNSDAPQHKDGDHFGDDVQDAAMVFLDFAASAKVRPSPRKARVAADQNSNRRKSQA